MPSASHACIGTLTFDEEDEMGMPAIVGIVLQVYFVRGADEANSAAIFGRGSRGGEEKEAVGGYV